MTSPTSKENLRQSLRQARDSYARGLDPAERAGLEAAAVGRLRAVLGPGVWASYLAMESESSPARVADHAPPGRWEKRRVGDEGVSTSSFRWSRAYQKKRH